MRQLRHEELTKLKRMVVQNHDHPLEVVIYARKSRQDKENASIDQQIAACQAFIGRHPKLMANTPGFIFSEDKASGMNLESRKEVQAALDVVRKGKARVFIVTKLDRLSRDSTHTIQLIKELESLGAMLIAGDDQGDFSAAGILSKQVIMATNEFTVRRSVEDTMAAKARKTELGYSCGGPGNYGYRVENKKYVINPEEAIVVNRVYDLFNLGHSLESITQMLFDEGHRPRYAERFSKATILAILKNERNYGKNIWNSERKRKKRKRVSFLEFDEVVCDDGIENPIISKSTFDLAQSILKTKTHSRTKSSNPGYLLTGLLKCSCGESMLGNTTRGGRNHSIRRTYICSGRKVKHTCKAKDINADYLEGALKQYFNEVIHTHVNVHGVPDKVFDMEFQDATKRIVQLHSEIKSEERLILKLALEKAKATSPTLVNALDKHLQSKDAYVQKLKGSLAELEGRKQDFLATRSKAATFDYFQNLTLSKEFMHQHIEKITADANIIHIEFKH
jgi:site-specific DNA recombinase